jgi:hypothetical protein
VSTSRPTTRSRASFRLKYSPMRRSSSKLLLYFRAAARAQEGARGNVSMLCACMLSLDVRLTESSAALWVKMRAGVRKGETIRSPSLKDSVRLRTGRKEASRGAVRGHGGLWRAVAGWHRRGETKSESQRVAGRALARHALAVLIGACSVLGASTPVPRRLHFLSEPPRPSRQLQSNPVEPSHHRHQIVNCK